MSNDELLAPCAFLQSQLGTLPEQDALLDYQHWWEATGREISAAVDRAGTPWLRMHDRSGVRCDERPSRCCRI